MKDNKGQLDFEFGGKKSAQPAKALVPKKAPTPRPRIELTAWDEYDGEKPKPSDEWGADLEYLKAKLIRRLKEAINHVEGNRPADLWNLRSTTWPWTKTGMILLDCIRLADAIYEMINAKSDENISSHSLTQTGTEAGRASHQNR